MKTVHDTATGLHSINSVHRILTSTVLSMRQVHKREFTHVAAPWKLTHRWIEATATFTDQKHICRFATEHACMHTITSNFKLDLPTYTCAPSMLLAGPKHDFKWVELRDILFHIQVSRCQNVQHQPLHETRCDSDALRMLSFQHREEKWTRPLRWNCWQRHPITFDW